MNLATLDLLNPLIVFVLPLLLLYIFVFVIIKRNSSKGQQLPPGPYAWPIVGNIFQIGKKPHIGLAKLARVHGPLMSIRLGKRVLVVGSSPNAASEILKIHDRDLSGRVVAKPLKITGSKVHNLALVYSDECDDGWRNLRNIYRSELFSTKALESQVEMREKKVMEMVNYLGSKEGQMVRIRDITFAVSLNILSNAFLSVDFVDFEGNGVGGGMMGCVRRLAEMAATQQLSDLYPILYPILGVWDSKSWYKKAIDMMAGGIWDVWADMIKEKRRNPSIHLSGQGDFTDVLIGKGFTDEQINPMLQELYSAGAETTSLMIEWVIVELLRNQEAMQKLQAELVKLIDGDMVTESNLPHLPYLEACFKETLRLHPPTPLLIPHRAVQTCEVMSYTIPKDSDILVNVWAIGRDPKSWNDPLSFKPERFIGSKLNFMGQDFEYLPFGSGRRMCPGLPLASKTTPLMIASLIHNFDWFLPNNMKPSEINMDVQMDFTMNKKELLCVIPKLREQFKN